MDPIILNPGSLPGHNINSAALLRPNILNGGSSPMNTYYIKFVVMLSGRNILNGGCLPGPIILNPGSLPGRNILNGGIITVCQDLLY